MASIAVPRSALEYGDDLGWYASNHDWIFEAHFDDFEGLKSYLEHVARLEVADVISAAVDESVTAQVQHRMMSG